MADLISRQAAIDAPRIFTKDCNPEHFVGHSNFIEYMGTVGIRSFGNWQYANGFNMGLTAAEFAIEKLPSAHPERPKGHWIDIGSGQECSECGEVQYGYDNFRYYCAKCGAEMKGEEDAKSM